jgi:hypothetical protein
MQVSLLLPFLRKSHRSFFLLSVILLGYCSLNAQMRITEFMYSGANGEFVEFTNVGTTAIDMNGWSFDDATRSPGAHNLSAFGTVMPGESVVATETSPASAFRSAWGLCAGIKIVGGYTNDNLGRSDEINLYNASQTLVDRLTFNDQASGGGPRTQNKSAWVSATSLGANNSAQWTLSAVNDAEGSFTSSGGDIGSPGKSTRATISFNPCVVLNGAPTISINTASTTNFLDGGITVSPLGIFAFSGVIADPTDPAANSGIDITIGDDATPAGDLTVTVSSNNLSVVPAANIIVTGSGSGRNIKINPAVVGYANITVAISDGTNTTSYVLAYAASAAAAHPANTRWHTGISDASDAIALDDTSFVTGDDEQNVLNTYSRNLSGLPLSSFNYTSGLNLPDPAKPEVDIEAATRSVFSTGVAYWLGSMSNGKSPFENKPNRDRLFATNITGTGASTSFSFAGYKALKSFLLSWGDANGYAFTASAAAGVDSKADDGFAAEGMVFGPDSTTLYIGFRAPLVPTASRTKAVIVPVLHFESWFHDGSDQTAPTLGAPIELDLGGRGIRDLIRLSNSTYIIIAGSADETLNGAIYKWSGKPTDKPILVNSADVASLNIEGAMPVGTDGQLSLSQLQLISDKGGDVLYNDGTEAKSLGENKYKKFRSDLVSGLNLELLSVSITSPATNSTFAVGQPVTVQAATFGGAIRVAFFAGSGKVAEDTSAPFTLTAQDVEPGVYLVTARAYNQQGDSAISDTVSITIAGCSGSGTISAEGFTDIPGTGLIALGSSAKYPNDPDVTAQLNQFEYGPNIGDNYGARVRGYICAPVTGNYIFYVSGDDQSQLFLSTDEDPQNIRRIAYLESRVGFRNWFATASQRSIPIRLIKGGRYYIESIHKEGTGSDHLSVGWVLPNGTFEAPVPGNRLSPLHAVSGNALTLDFTGQMRAAEPAAAGLTMSVSPNPSVNYFNISLRSNSSRNVSVRIFNIEGKMIEMFSAPANGMLQIGSKYRPGMYFIEAQQEGQVSRMKIIKQ